MYPAGGSPAPVRLTRTKGSDIRHDIANAAGWAVVDLAAGAPGHRRDGPRGPRDPGRAEHAHRRGTRRRQVRRPPARRRPRSTIGGLPAGPGGRQEGRARPVAGCATRFIGPSIDEAIQTMQWLQGKIDERLDWLLDHSERKITADMGWPVYLVAVDEIAYYSATGGTRIQQKTFSALNRDIVARGRAPGVIAVEATQRPSRGHHPDIAAGSVRLPVGLPLLHRSQLRHHPRARVGVQGLHRRGHRPPGPGRVLAAGRGRHPPPRQGRLPV